jgi:LacI family transcriptional regulator
VTPRRAGIKDVAGHAGVGISTVSRVFTGSAEVKPELKERVLSAAAELGYEPDILARSLRTGATMSVGFIADDLSNHPNIGIATGAEGALRASSHSLLVMNSEMETRRDTMNIRVLQARRVDALMMTPVSEDDPELVATLNNLDIPVVVVEGELPGADSVSFVVSDHRSGAAAALRHLLELGHTNVVLITGPAEYRSARQCRLALDDVAADAGPEIRLGHVGTHLSHEGGRSATAAFLHAPDRPTAIVVGGGQLLTGVLEVIAASGLELGRDVSLVTADPVSLTGVFRPPIAAISRDSLGLGRHAADILLRQLSEPSLPPQQVTLPTIFEPRASAGPPPDR